jgi:hypothetical protein
MTLTAHKATTGTAEQPRTGYANVKSETKALKAGTQALQAGTQAVLTPMAATQPTAETVRQLIKDALQEGIRGSFKEVSESINALKESVESINGGALAETRQIDVRRPRMSMKPMGKGTQWGDVKLSGNPDGKIRWKTQWDDGKPKANSVDIVSVKKISETPIHESEQEVLNSWNKAAVAAMQKEFGNLEVTAHTATLLWPSHILSHCPAYLHCYRDCYTAIHVVMSNYILPSMLRCPTIYCHPCSDRSIDPL